MPDNITSAMYDIPLGFFFKVEFEGIKGVTEKGADVRFQEVTGISAELGVETIDEGGENRFSHRLPARAKFNNLVLKRGMLIDSKLRDWFNNALYNFEFAPANITVKLLNESDEILASWQFLNAWPVKWTTSDFKAMENAIVIETVELAYQYFEKLKK